MAGIAVDGETGDLYVAAASTGSFLFHVNRGDEVVVSDHYFMGGVEGFYPYVATDIVYHDGAIITTASGGWLIRYNVTSRETETLARFDRFDTESGLARVGRSFYVTPGTGDGSLMRLDFDQNHSQEIKALPSLTTLDYDETSRTAVVANLEGKFYVIDLEAGVLNSIPNLEPAPASKNFAL